MASIVHISEAVSIGIHAVLCLGSAPERYWTTREILQRFSFSEAHLAKIMAALAKAGLVKAVRGPRGGARLNRPPGQITLLEIYEAIDGPVTMEGCLLGAKGCGAACCQIGPRLAAFNREIRDYLASVRLSDLAGRTDGAICLSNDPDAPAVTSVANEDAGQGRRPRCTIAGALSVSK